MDFAVENPPGNSIVHTDYNPDDGLAAGFGLDGYAFINSAAIFRDLGEGVAVAAWVDESPDFLLSGFWPGWRESGAAGLPLVIHGEAGVHDTILIGMDTTFRAHPEDSFRLVANAIYGSLD